MQDIDDGIDIGSYHYKIASEVSMISQKFLSLMECRPPYEGLDITISWFHQVTELSVQAYKNSY